MSKYKIKKDDKTYQILKKDNSSLTIKELYILLKILIIKGKGDYKVQHESFCCEVTCINIFNRDSEISID